jgi:hypothetical protein
MRNLEHLEAIALMTWWSLEANRRKIDQRLLIHIPNEGRVGGPGQMRAGYKKKLEGLRAGTPDYVLCIPKGEWHGFWLEIKSKNGRVSPMQDEMLNLLHSQGYKTGVYFDWWVARAEIEEYLGPI